MIWLLLLPIPAEAQNATSAILTPPETGDFPLIQAYLEVYNEQGDFIHNLVETDVTIIEDNKRIRASELTELEVGAQFVVALNLGPTFAIRDSNGISRYQTLQESLRGWASRHLDDLDDLSFLTNDGPENIHLSNASQLLSGFDEYGTDPRAATPSLDVLVRAINVASDPVAQIGMGRAILLLTPPPNRAGTATLQSIISLAKQERVRVHVWMVSSTEFFASEEAAQLAELAHQTGGRFFVFSGIEEIPEIEDYLAPLRSIYSLSYESKIRNSQPHQIYVQIDSNEIRTTSAPQDFDLEVLPPNPIFLSPPLQIFRANRTAFSESLSDEADYTPKEQELDIVVEFPDGRLRPLVRTTLYIDGEIADENTAPPFDTFTWDLSTQNTSNQHILQVEVLDSYGLGNVSIEHIVQISVQQTPQSILSTIVQNGPVIAGAAVAVAGGVLVLVLILGGRIHPKTFGRGRKNTHIKKKGRDERNDPITQPVLIEIEPAKKRFPHWLNRISWPQRGTSSIKPVAFLESLTETNHVSQKTQIPITYGEITFGRDPKLATHTFNDKAVGDLHARLRVVGETDFWIYDEGSIAGTWVNYTPIDADGQKLAHGDIIHIGKIGFRFKISDRKQIPKPIVIQQETGL